MTTLVLTIDGMMCGMCEAHVNDAIRRAFDPKRVTSSHRKGQTVILSDGDLPDDRLEAVIRESGYTLVRVERTAPDEVQKPRGLRAMFRK